jgi:hypothetical protein
MSSVNNVENNKFVLPHLAVSTKIRKGQADTEATLAGLLLLAKSLSEAVDAPKEQKIVQPNFRANETAPAAPSQGPSDAQMQLAYGALMELLAQLQTTLAKYSHSNAKNSGEIGTALINEMTATCNSQIEELEKMSKEEANASWWSTFAKWMEGILGGLTFLASLLGGQPQLAAIILTLTVMSLTGGTQKVTQWVADLISKALVANHPGMSKETADKIAKIIADALMVVVVVAVTVASAGAGSASAIEDAAANAGGLAAEVDSSLGTKLLNFIQENNPFAKLPVRANYALLGGSQALASTNFFGDAMAAACMHMKEGKEKEILQTVLGIVLNLLTALAGAGSSAAACLGSQAESSLSTFLKGIKEFKLSVALKALMAAEFLGGTLDSSGQIASGSINIELGQTLNQKGEFQALLTMLQALLSMNSSQLSAIAKDGNSQQRASAQGIANLSRDLNKAQEEVARQTQV